MDEYSQEVFIYKSEDLQNIAVLKKKADTATRLAAQVAESGTGRMGDAESPAQAQDELRAAIEDAATRAEVVVLQHLGKTRWRELLAAHRPRYARRMVDGQLQDVMDDEDREWNVNTETFPDALLGYVDPNDPEIRTIKEPTFATGADRAKWLEKRAGDFDKMWATAYFLNSQQTLDPKALLDSLESSLI